MSLTCQLWSSRLVGLAAPAGPLAEVVRCYDDLDYECADEALARVLLEPLDNATMVQARVYDALLGTAWRDPRRVRRAVRTIYGIDPGFEPQNLPPAVMAVFEAERPAPPPPPQIRLGVDYTYVTLFDAERDAAWWQDGAGVSVSVGTRLAARYELSVDFRAVQHLPNTGREGLEGLNQYNFDIGRRWSCLGWFLCMEGTIGAAWTIPSIDPYTGAPFDRCKRCLPGDPSRRLAGA